MLKKSSLHKFLGLFVATALLGLASHAASADTAKVGEQAPGFELKDVVTGDAHSLADFRGKTVVLVFQSMTCPWDFMRPEAGYQRVLSPMATEYAEKDVVFLAINSNHTESVEQLSSYHTQHNMTYPILKDEGNVVADAYAARTTPHIYIVDGDGVLRYKGGIEKAPVSPAQCGEMDEQYLKPVLDALLAGEELPHTETVSKGCTIKRK